MTKDIIIDSHIDDIELSLTTISCTGEIVSKGKFVLKRGLNKMHVPANGIAELRY